MPSLAEASVPEDMPIETMTDPANVEAVIAADAGEDEEIDFEFLENEYMKPVDVPAPSHKGAKFVKYGKDGSAQFDNGVSLLPDGSIAWVDNDTGTKFVQKNPYVKAVSYGKVPSKQSSVQQSDEAAARKNVRRDQFPVGPEGDKQFDQAKTQVLNTSSGKDEISQSIADAIIAGEQPPELKGMYRYGPGIRKALRDKGYNLTDAQLDWQATQRHTATLEGPQQLRMKQAIDNAYHSLDVIDDLSAQWEAGRFPALTKVRLEAAKQGALGKDAQKLAVQLEAQISDVTSELGNVYMGGNSPTDHSLTLAAKNLSASWSRETLKAATDLARKNLQIRDNSMKSVGTSRSDNQYDQKQVAPQPSVTPQPSAAPTQSPEAQAIKEQYRAGKITEEQAIAAIAALGK